MDAGAARRGARATPDGDWAAAAVRRSPRPARSSTARRPCSCAPTRTTTPAGRPVRERLLAARDGRPQPARDDKVVTAWNGLAIAGAGRGRRAARRAGLGGSPPRPRPSCCCGTHLVDGRLRRSLPRRGRRRAGRRAGGLRRPGRGAARAAPGHRGAALAGRRGRAARRGAGPVRRRPGRVPRHRRRRRAAGPPAWDPTDGPTPSGAAAAAGALLTHAALSGRTDHREAAEAALATLAAGRRGVPAGRRLGGRGRRGRAGRPAAGRGRPAAASWSRWPGGGTSPGLVVVAGAPDAPGRAAAGRPAAGRRAARPRTSAAGSSATGRRPTRPRWPRRSGRCAEPVLSRC